MAKQKAKTVDMSVNLDELDQKESQAVAEAVAAKEGENAAPKKVARTHVRSNKYQAVRSRVDRTKVYSLKDAVELIQKTSYSKFAGTVVADMIVKDEKISVEVSFPYSTGKVTRVAVASDELLAKVESGVIDFDILVAHPSFMGKIARLAKVLGPKGLMPNPKNGTVSPDPEKRAKELASGKTTIKTERKAPLMHVIIGKASQPSKELIANAETLIKLLGSGKIIKMTLSATMSPGVKIDLSKFTTV